MRRKDREVTDERELLAILDECHVCRIAVHDEQGLYIVPLNFGYSYENSRLTLYFHGAKEGRKIDAARRVSPAAFEMDCGGRLIEAPTACGHGYAYKSLIGTGALSLVGDGEEKKRALALIMRCQTGRDFTFDDKAADSVSVLRLDVDAFTGKRRA